MKTDLRIADKDKEAARISKMYFGDIIDDARQILAAKREAEKAKAEEEREKAIDYLITRMKFGVHSAVLAGKNHYESDRFWVPSEIEILKEAAKRISAFHFAVKVEVKEEEGCPELDGHATMRISWE